MVNVMDYVVDSLDTIMAWISTGLKQTAECYCDLETADTKSTLVARDGSLVSVIALEGATAMIGTPEFVRIHAGISQSLQATLARPGHGVQVLFTYDRDGVETEIEDIYLPARQTAKLLELDLDDLFNERISHLAKYCSKENVYFVLWTRPGILTSDQQKKAKRDKQKSIKNAKTPPFVNTQNLIAPIHELRNSHDAFVKATLNDLEMVQISANLLNIYDALYEVRMTTDPDFTSRDWRPVLPGDKLTERVSERYPDDISYLLYPSLPQQLLPRDAERIDLRTVQIGDRIYTSVFIDLFPKDIKSFMHLFNRIHPSQIPWRISFLIESHGLQSLKLRGTLAAVLAFSTAHNRLLSDAINELAEMEINGDDAVVKLRVVATTWAPEGDIKLLRIRTSQLSKALQGWGGCEVSEVSGDPFGGVVSSMLAVSDTSEAIATAAPLYDVVEMLPITRPASPWKTGALLFRSPDGKPWPFQPGSTQQTTWIDLIYARPGSGKSVLSNAINLALCLSGGIKRLPRIAIIDIGPSSSGLISLIKEALPREKKYLAAYHRLRMTPEYAINPFDTQLGCRFPTPQERGFLVNFLTLLATPLGSERPYDGVSDMAGLVVDELYKNLTDSANPYTYTAGLEPLLDTIIEEIGFVLDEHTTWWEITDALFLAGFSHEAMLAQRHATPLLADAASVCRSQVVEDLYGDIKVPTGESIIDSFSRMVSSAIREYPILSRITEFDLGDARIVSLDLDEVAKTGGEAADKQTAVMYMLGRYILARHYYLTEDCIHDMPEAYRKYHHERVTEIREDPKRIVFDEFHRTAKAHAVREQVIVDMREGRKWKVQVALLSQSVDDFEKVMIEFATSIYIMDAGPAQAVRRTTEIFGLSETAQVALTNRVHGPREGGATFLAQFATKAGMNTQLLTCTIGPIELWAFSTTAEDAKLRNILYNRLGPRVARKVLARIFPSGSAAKLIEEKLMKAREIDGLIEEATGLSVVASLAEDILKEYSKNPQFNSLSI